MMRTVERVEQLAAERGLSLRALADICDIPYSTIMNTRKRGGQLNVDTIERICRGLKIPLRDFFDDNQPGPPGPGCQGGNKIETGRCE